MAITTTKDQDNIVTITMDLPGKPMNVLNDELMVPMAEAIDGILVDIDNTSGIILASGKKDFIAGADIEMLIALDTTEKVFDMVENMKAMLRKLETCGKPVVAAMNGTTLGGGYEVALAAHRRICINNPRTQIGLPEVKIGAFPGGGATARLPRMIGIQQAMPLMLEGKTLRPEKALAAGLIEELAVDADDLMAKAKAWIKANPSAQAPWDVKGFKFPGGDANNPRNVQMLAIAPAMLHAKTWGNYPAPENCMKAITEGSRVDFDTACRIESRLFAATIADQTSKNMMSTLWFQLNAIKRGASRPEGVEPKKVQKLGVLGCGLMGAGIAFVSAKVGIEVVMKDVSQEAAEKGKDWFKGVTDKQVARKRMTQEKADEILGRMHPTGDYDDLAGCDLVIEAVFEDRELKANVTQATEAVLGEDAVFSSNTSTLPITGLAEASRKPENFIGLHFFSPVEKMPLVEIIKGEKTNDETLALAFDYVLQIKKTPIVVNDSRGFYTSRVFSSYVNEGMAMLAEGIDAQMIENAGLMTGMPMAPLALTDEVAISLCHHIMAQTAKDMEAEGKTMPDTPAVAVVNKMVEELDRPGKRATKGFYDYPEGGKKALWPGLKEHFNATRKDVDINELQERLLFIQANETARCYEEDVVCSLPDANIGSIFGWGFAPWAGGTLQYIEHVGLDRFIERSQELAAQFGERFKPADILLKMQAEGKSFKYEA
jgi:3-hydroxyacyl-CoA dehydrogenase/enoyl-CoA hydratase/3-hydroxybutyryl-CoA epimerase